MSSKKNLICMLIAVLGILAMFLIYVSPNTKIVIIVVITFIAILMLLGRKLQKLDK